MDAPSDLRFSDFFEALNQFVILLDRRGKMIHANRAALDLTGLAREQILGRPVWQMPWPALSRADRRSLKQAIAQAAHGEQVHSELVLRAGGELKLAIDLTIQPVRDGKKPVRYILAEGWDDTVYRQTSEALYRSEARFRTIYEKAGVGILVKGLDGRIFDANPAFQAMLGYSLDELVRMRFLEITHPEDRPANRQLFEELVSGKRASYSTEKRYVHKDGRTLWGNITTSMVRGPDPAVQYVIAIVENITPQKEIEAELIELQRRLMREREMERVRVAQDLHDGPLQEIIGISFLVKELNSVPARAAEGGQVRSIQEGLQRVSRSIRAICGELRPPTLVPFGLEKTIRSHAREFRAAHPELRLELGLAHDGQELSELVRIVLFRIYQEAMNNILRHSGATRISVRFELEEDRARLEVRDNGTGFALPDRWMDFANEGHLGLVGAIEQAKEVGGSLKISSTRGRGTAIRAVLPVREETPPIRARVKEER